jgi:amidophosphoribosyltransferase
MRVQYLREVEPGEIVTLDKSGLSSRFFVDRDSIIPAHCMYELTYYAEQTSRIFGTNAYQFRKELGKRLAIEHPANADVVIPIPHSAIPSAIGYAQQSKIPLEMGIVSSHYVGRTLIDPNSKLRDLVVNLKVTLVEEVIAGNRVVLVDDSIVRGTTMRGITRKMREAYAKEIHMRISCPPIRFPCLYGVGFKYREELLAHGLNIEQIKDSIGVDSVGYLSLEGLLGCANLSADHYCTACWTGKYRLSPDFSGGKHT